jgi:hypothetical protein
VNRSTIPRDCFVWFPGERVDGPSRIPEQSNLRENTMAKPLDVKTAGVPTNNVPVTNGSWLKRRADAVRKRGDAFPGPNSEVEKAEREDRRR